MVSKINAALEKRLPERRVFLRSDTETRFVRLSPSAQLTTILVSTGLVAWTIIATSVLLMDSISSGNQREQALRAQTNYETRLDALSQERDTRTNEAHAAQQRFNVAMDEISQMQSALLASEDRRKELETGIDVIQSTLRRTMNERDEARAEANTFMVALEGSTGSARTDTGRAQDIAGTVDFLAAALEATAAERDSIANRANQAETVVDQMQLEARLVEERNNRIFQQLEEAVSISLLPLNKLLVDAGQQPERIIEQVRRGYSGQGGPLMPLSFSTRGSEDSADSLRANDILSELDRLNLYNIAARKLPFANPVRAAYRFTSRFGMRSDPTRGGQRMHTGVDLAGARGTPIYATADGIVIKAGWSTGYGKLIKIQHEFGVETRYAHLSEIGVVVGQRVSRGDRIGGMGSSGRVTGVHVHYEVRQDGEPVNPMDYIRAANNVF
ncbi:MAG: DUF5930 domain-containing protein [Halocynthiibacter sp.]